MGRKLLGIFTAALVSISLIASVPFLESNVDQATVIEGTLANLHGHSRSHPIAFSLVLVLIVLVVWLELSKLGLARLTCCSSRLRPVMFVLTVLTDIAPNGFLPLPYLAHGLHPITSCAVVVVCAAVASQTMIWLHEAAVLTKTESYKGLCAAVSRPWFGTSVSVLVWASCFGNLIAYLGLATDL